MSLRDFCSRIKRYPADEKIVQMAKLRADVVKKRKLRKSNRSLRLNAVSDEEKYTLRRQIHNEEVELREKEDILMSGATIIEASPEPEIDGNPYAPQLEMVDGTLCVTQCNIVPKKRVKTQIIIEEDKLRYYNQSYFQNKKNLAGCRWQADEIDLLYKGLSSWGTNFEAISRMIPGKTRDNVKSKYKREEQKNPDKITVALNSNNVMPLKEYSDATGMNLE